MARAGGAATGGVIYLDYQATTPLAREARAAMLPWLDEEANPHSPHAGGRAAKAAVEAAREQVMRLFGGQAHPRPLPQAGGERLYFTSGATEALNWALKGTWARREVGRERVVTIATEHAAVLDTCAWLAEQGAELVVLPVGAEGLVELDAARAAIDGRTAIVAAMLVNNEIGVVQDIEALGAMARAAGAVMVCDAVQGFGRVALPVEACDLIAVSAHKLHGPKGVGALWVREGHAPEPLLHGGGQEGGARSGTLSPMLCAGFGAAAAVAEARRAEDLAHVEALHARMRAALPDWRVNGSETARWPGNLNLRRDGIDAGRLISEVREVAFSAGSACASGSGRASLVLRAIGLDETQARSSIRLGFGRYTNADEVDAAAALIAAATARQGAWA